jgi:hypothetical protein
MMPQPGGFSVQAGLERENLARRLAEGAEVAFARAGLVERSFRLHDRVFVLRCAGKELADNMCCALAHLVIETTEPPSLTIDCWNSAATGSHFPMPPWPRDFFKVRGEIRGLDGPEIRIASFSWLQLWNIYFPKTGRAYYCLDSDDPFSAQQLGSPALAIFGCWLSTLGWQLTRAAAVGTERGGVLLAGRGGAGKSTLAFSTIGNSLRYVSDDYCVLVPGTPSQAAALYNSGKLGDDSLALLPICAGKRPAPVTGRRERRFSFCTNNFPANNCFERRCAPSCSPISARRKRHSRPCRPARFLPSSARAPLCNWPGVAQPDFVRLMRLLHDLPTYRLRHGTDLAATHQVLIRLCES